MTPVGIPYISVATRRSALRRAKVAPSWSGISVPLVFFVFYMPYQSFGLEVKSLFTPSFLFRWWVVSERQWSPRRGLWVEFQNQIQRIELRRCTTWVDISGVPGQGGVTEAVHWRDVLSSGASVELEALKLRDPDHFFVGGLHQQDVKAWDNVLEGHPLVERIDRWICQIQAPPCSKYLHMKLKP